MNEEDFIFIDLELDFLSIEDLEKEKIIKFTKERDSDEPLFFE